MVAFGRYDLHRFGGAASLVALMERKYPSWKRLESEGKVARLHNMDQKATVIWPGPEMRQILCACPRVF